MRRIRNPMDRKFVLGVDGGLNVLTVESSNGGVSIVGGGGKIDINNTLDERLKLLETDALPSVRTTLFGKNENRRFYD